MADRKSIGSILLQQRAVSPQQLNDALKRGGPGKPPLVSRLTQEGVIRETQALKALSEQSGCPGIDLNQVCIRLADIEGLPLETAQEHCMLPVLVKGERVFVAMANPADRAMVQRLEMALGKKVFPYIALKATLRRVIDEAYALKDSGRRHFVGPSCPRETLQKAGVSFIPPPLKSERDIHQLQQTAATEAIELSEHNLQPRDAQAAVVVDDQMAAATPGQTDFPDANRVDDDETVTDDEGAFDDFAFDEPQVAPSERPRVAAQVAPAGRHTMLVVDDEPAIRQMLVRIFSDQFHVLEASDGEVALQMVRDYTPRVIVLDATLPKMHGFEIARQLKGSERYGDIPIIMVSAVYRGWRFAADIKEVYGVDRYVEKPFEVRTIVGAVSEVMATPEQLATRHETSAAAEPHLKAGMQAYRNGHLPEAIAHMQAGAKADPLAFLVRYQLGLLYGKVGQTYDAIQELEAALNTRPAYFPALKNLAVLYQNAGFRHKAIEMWERCLDAAPDQATRQSLKQHLVAVL